MPNLIDQISDYLTTFMAFPDDENGRNAPRVLATWVIHTWTLDAANVSPMPYAYSPEPGSGKSLLMELLMPLTPNPAMTGGITAPALMNLAGSDDKPTIYVDEVDMFFNKTNASTQMMQQVLNMGYKRGGKAFRVAGQGVRRIDVYGPKMLAGIDNASLPNTLVDRAIPIMLLRATREQRASIQHYVESDHEDWHEDIRCAIEDFADANMDSLSGYARPVIDNTSPRTAEIITPLLAIAKCFGEDQSMQNALVSMISAYKASLPTDATVDFIKSMAGVFYMVGTRILSRDLLTFFEYNPDSMKDQKTLAERMDKIGIKAKTVRSGTSRGQGYDLAQFLTLFDKYDLLDAEGQIDPAKTEG